MMLLRVACIGLLAASAVQAQGTGSGDPEAAFVRALAHLDSRNMEAAVSELEVAVAGHHRPAAAQLARLLVMDRRVARDEARALALASQALQGASLEQRLGLEEIYQSVYCAVSLPIRQAALAHRRQSPEEHMTGAQAAPKSSSNDAPALAILRMCADGARVVMPD